MNAVRLSTVTLFFLWLGLPAIKSGLNAAEPLDNYVGAWLFHDDRKQVWTGAKDATNRGIVFYEQFKAICGPVQKRWFFHFDPGKQRYVGTLKTTFNGEIHVSAVLGEWDQENSAMSWTIESDALGNAKIRHRFLNGKVVVSALRKADNPGGSTWTDLGTLSPTAR